MSTHLSAVHLAVTGCEWARKLSQLSRRLTSLPCHDCSCVNLGTWEFHGPDFGQKGRSPMWRIRLWLRSNSCLIKTQERLPIPATVSWLIYQWYHTVHSKTAVPNHCGTKDRFHGRQFSTDQGRRDGYRMIQAHYTYMCTLFLLCGNLKIFWLTLGLGFMLLWESNAATALTGGGAQAVMWAMRSSCKYRWRFTGLPTPHLLLCSLIVVCGLGVGYPCSKTHNFSHCDISKTQALPPARRWIVASLQEQLFCRWCWWWH